MSKYKTIVIEFFSWGLVKGNKVTFDPRTGRSVETPGYLTADDYRKWNADLPRMKQEVVNIIKPMLINAGFEYGSDLWQWSTRNIGNRKLQLWVKMVFEDTDRIGSSALMKMIYSTGLFNYDASITKYYS